MTGPPCLVVLAIGLFFLIQYANGEPLARYSCDMPERFQMKDASSDCQDYHTGEGGLDKDERDLIPHYMNQYRGFIAKQCDKLESGKPELGYFKKVTYSCGIEANITLECSAAKSWNLDEDTGHALRWKVPTNDNTSGMYQMLPELKDIDIKPDDQSLNSDFRNSKSLRFMLNQDAEEVGCKRQKCDDGFYYYECTTWRNHTTSGPLYKKGKACEIDEDCPELDFGRCNRLFGMCIRGSKYVCAPEFNVPLLFRRKEKCLQTLDTGSEHSDDERERIVNLMNRYRGLVANQCNQFYNHNKPKSVMFPKITYSCELEAQASFTCPDRPEWFGPSWDRVLRVAFQQQTPENHKRIFGLSALASQPRQIMFRPATSEFWANTFPGAKVTGFFLTQNATEIGCFYRYCHNVDMYACTTGLVFPREGSMYTPGKRCEKPSDCENSGIPSHTSCNTEFGMCEKGNSGGGDKIGSSPLYDINCIMGNPDVNVNLCAFIIECIKTNSSITDLCKSVILIAVKSDESYKIVGVGTAVGKDYILTSVSSPFRKFRNDLYYVVGGKTAYDLQTDKVYAELFVGHFDMTKWQDLVLIKLAPKSVKFDNYVKLNGQKALPDKIETLTVLNKKLNFAEQSKSDDLTCANVFKDDVFKFDESYNMACAADSTKELTSFLSGAPVVVKKNGKYVLYGVRSMVSIAPNNENAYLITPIKPSCEWLNSVSGGAVKCV